MKIIMVLLTAFMLATASYSQAPSTKRSTATEAELRSLVRRWDEAYVKGDTAILDRLLADEFAFVGGPTKAQYLASFKSTDFVIESAVSTEVQVQVYDDAAVVTGVDTITGRNNGQVFQTKWLYMDVWIKREKRWQCVKTYSMPVQNR